MFKIVYKILNKQDVGTCFWQSGVDHFFDRFFDGDVGRKDRNLGTCNRHHEYDELVYLLVKIEIVLNEKWKSKVNDIKNL